MPISSYFNYYWFIFVDLKTVKSMMGVKLWKEIDGKGMIWGMWEKRNRGGEWIKGHMYFNFSWKYYNYYDIVMNMEQNIFALCQYIFIKCIHEQKFVLADNCAIA